MKIRNGFVSNSSSSSFVLLGVNYTGNNLMELLEKYDLDNVDDTDILGIRYFSISDDDYDCTSVIIAPDTIQKDFDRLYEIFGEDAKIKWFSGVEAC